VHEKYRLAKDKEQIEQEQRKLRERETELASLQMFQKTVNSLGQFVENGLAALARAMSDKEKETLGLVDRSLQPKVAEVFAELNKDVEFVAKGVKSMTDLSALVTSKIENLKQGSKSAETPAAEPERVNP